LIAVAEPVKQRHKGLHFHAFKVIQLYDISLDVVPRNRQLIVSPFTNFSSSPFPTTGRRKEKIRKEKEKTLEASKITQFSFQARKVKVLDFLPILFPRRLFGDVRCGAKPEPENCRAGEKRKKMENARSRQAGKQGRNRARIAEESLPQIFKRNLWLIQYIMQLSEQLRHFSIFLAFKLVFPSEY
jgi:hypothetical protein